MRPAGLAALFAALQLTTAAFIPLRPLDPPSVNLLERQTNDDLNNQTEAISDQIQQQAVAAQVAAQASSIASAAQAAISKAATTSQPSAAVVEEAAADKLNSTSDFRQLSMSAPQGLPGQMVMFGDSITQYSFQAGGTGQALADAWQRKLDVVNRGYAGWTTQMLNYVAPWVLTSATPIQVLLLWTGTNDMNQGRNVDDFSADLTSLANSFFDTRPASSSKLTWYDPIVLMLSPPPNAITSVNTSTAYAAAVKKVASNINRKHHRQALYLDAHQAVLDAALSKSGDWAAQIGSLTIDGVHLNPDGYSIVTWQILNILNSQANYLYPASLPQSFPAWFNVGNAASAFPALPAQSCSGSVARAIPPASK